MTSPAFTTLTWTEDGAVVTITLDNPPVNAMSQVMFEELGSAFRAVATRDDVRAVILCGANRYFSAGGDIEELRGIGAHGDAKLKVIRDAYWAVVDCPVPVVGALHGKALGGGAALISLCDVVICDETAEIGVPEIKVGVMGGAGHLMRILPQQVVRRMFVTGEPVSAALLLTLGAVTRVVPTDQLHDAARDEAALITRHSGVAVRFAKQDLTISEASSLKDRYELEQLLTRELSNYADSYEAGTAFLERRAPVFGHDRRLRQTHEGRADHA